MLKASRAQMEAKMMPAGRELPRWQMAERKWRSATQRYESQAYQFTVVGMLVRGCGT
jgi:hypothetical protein